MLDASIIPSVNNKSMRQKISKSISDLNNYQSK